MSPTESRNRVPATRPRRGPILFWFIPVLAITLAGCDGQTLYDDLPDDGGPTTPTPTGQLSVALESYDVPERMEDGDQMKFSVRWSPRSGGPTTATLGVSARITAPGMPTAIFVKLQEVNVATGPAVASLSVPYSQVRAALPTSVQRGVPLAMELTAYALDQAGRCVAAVKPELQQLPCEVISGVPAAPTYSEVLASVTGVFGTTAPLPAGVGAVGDLALHNGSSQLFVSNRTGHTVEVLQLNGSSGPTFRSSGVPVGSQPWGLSLSRDNSEVIVANSGGTNFSFVSVSQLTERRMDIPRMTLHDITLNVSDDGVVCTLAWHNYTDRPQFVTEDTNGNLLYSAATSAAAPTGTIRRVRTPGAGQSLTGGFLFPGAPANTPMYTPPLEVRGVAFQRPDHEEWGPLDYAIANVDSITTRTVYVPPFAFPTCTVTLHEHVPGSPQQRIDVGPVPISQIWDAFQQLHDNGSDVVVVPNYAWDLQQAIETSDTTYVASSADRNFVAFAPGARTPDARVTLWNAGGLLSRFDDMADLMNNTSDRIVGVDLNGSGTLGVIRGTSGAYFFDRDLRLKGTAVEGLVGGIGAALLTQSGGRTLAVMGTAQNTIRVVETDHYRTIAEIPVRDRVTGALRVGPGRESGAGATVYAVTEGGVLVLSVPQTALQ